MSTFEDLIKKGARKSQSWALSMAGESLYTFPEHLIMVVLGRYISEECGRKGCDVYLDCTLRKIFDNIGIQKPSRIPKKNVRFDLVIWKGETKRLKALIEIKKANGISHIKPDAKKLRDNREFIKDALTKRPNTKLVRQSAILPCYLLFYSEVEGEGRKKLLEKRGHEWAKDEDIDGTLIWHFVKKWDAKKMYGFYLIKLT